MSRPKGPQRYCTFPDCGRVYESKGLCSGHRQQQKLGKELTPLKIIAKPNTTGELCPFPECGRLIEVKGFCSAHYNQLRRGQPLTPISSTCRPPNTPPIIEYDEAPNPKPDKCEGPCHIWKWCKDSKGYGRVGLNGETILVHIYTWELVNGPTPEGLELDHLCRVPSCCNPKHLEAVTHRTNMLRGEGTSFQINGAKTHCKQGHEFTPENTKILPPTELSPNGGRACKTCLREWKHQWRLREKLKKEGKL